MREKIIRQSISCLQRDGLRFSLDEVAQTLKVSKKTIYKYFATKEELALAMYGTFYGEAEEIVGQICGQKTRDSVKQMLTVYSRSHAMVRDEVFNKYALNTTVRAFAQASHARMRAQMEEMLPASDRGVLMLILDGACRALSDAESDTDADKVIEKLVGLVC